MGLFNEKNVVPVVVFDEAGNPIVGGASVLPLGTDRSGVIAVGGSAQSLAAANPARKSLKGQNISSGDLWINEAGGVAQADAAGSYRVGANGTFSISTSRAVSVVGAVAGQKWTATET